jgi:hypothetical protein
VGIVAILVAAFALGIYRARRAASAGVEGKAALARAQDDMAGQRIDDARRHLELAADAFARMHGELRSLGPLLPLARITPWVRVQIRGAEAFANAGSSLASGGLDLVSAADQILKPTDTQVNLAQGILQLRSIETALSRGIGTIDGAIQQVGLLDGFRLVGPLDDARRDFLSRLPRVRAQAVSAERGLAAFIAFAGDPTPRRFLVFSQNPDEVRPTGGYLGTYGILATGPAGIRLERYEGIENWYQAHPEAAVSPEEAPTALQEATPPQRLTLANINWSADFPTDAQLAMELWRRGGEQPVDGVLLVTPELLARVLSVVGPVQVAAFGETVTADNLLERIDFYTHRDPARTPERRKDFVAALAEATLKGALASKGSQWQKMAMALGQGFTNHEAMIWSTVPEIADQVAQRSWDRLVQPTLGDYHAEAEFEYEAKNGRSLRRSYDHVVVIEADGSAVITTTMTIANTAVTDTFSSYNIDSSSYVTIYGPSGARLAEAADPPDAQEVPLAGHPAYAWLRAALPLAVTSLTVVWEAPAAVVHRGDGTLEYRLSFATVTAHQGDVLHLSVELPTGWSWDGAPPPNDVPLDQVFTGAWAFRRT